MQVLMLTALMQVRREAYDTCMAASLFVTARVCSTLIVGSLTSVPEPAKGPTLYSFTSLLAKYIF
jgi:hypothetical protein